MCIQRHFVPKNFCEEKEVLEKAEFSFVRWHSVLMSASRSAVECSTKRVSLKLRSQDTGAQKWIHFYAHNLYFSLVDTKLVEFIFILHFIDCGI